MLFMVIETYRPGAAAEVYLRHRSRGRMAPPGVRYVASWVDLDVARCFQVMEAPAPEAIAAWTSRWDDLVDFEVIAVQTSEEAARAILGPDPSGES